jgi:hypothetical protein
MLLKQIESVVLFVQDIDAASIWYAELFQTEVQYENHHYAFIRTPGCLIGFHPQDSKCQVESAGRQSIGRWLICRRRYGNLNKRGRFVPRSYCHKPWCGCGNAA